MPVKQSSSIPGRIGVPLGDVKRGVVEKGVRKARNNDNEGL